MEAQTGRIEVTYGLTQNLGDYSNVKMTVSIEEAIMPGDDPMEMQVALLEQARIQVQAAVDDALEQNNRRVVYYDGTLFEGRYSSVRNCAVVVPLGCEMPNEVNWKYKDSWHSFGISSGMRLEKALQTLVEKATRQKPGYTMLDLHDGDLNKLPPLPDAGPEPLWNQKKLAYWFGRCGNIPEDRWEELGALEHVTEKWLESLYQLMDWGTSSDRYIEAILSGKLPDKPDYSDNVETDDFDEDE